MFAQCSHAPVNMTMVLVRTYVLQISCPLTVFVFCSEFDIGGLPLDVLYSLLRLQEGNMSPGVQQTVGLYNTVSDKWIH